MLNPQAPLCPLLQLPQASQRVVGRQGRGEQVVWLGRIIQLGESPKDDQNAEILPSAVCGNLP